MNTILKIKFLGLVALAFTSCAKDAASPVQESLCDVAMEVSFDASMSEDCSITKTTYDATNHIALWKREDQAGVIASYGSGSFTDARMQPFNIENKGRCGNEFLSSATFTGTLTNKGNQIYTYHVVYPYTAFQTVSDITAVSSRLEERQNPDLKSWDGACDMLASKPVTAESFSAPTEHLSIQFTRLFGMLRLKFGTSVTDTYGSEIVETISVESAEASDKLAGKFTVDLSSTTASAPVMSTAAGETFNKITLDYRGRNASLSAIDAYFVVNPGTYADVTITVKTANHTLTFQRANMTVTRGNVASATLTWKNAVDNAAASAPLLPKNPDTLRVMTFGHSYVNDSMEYMDELLNAAGVKSVVFAHFYIGNCSLQYYWGHVQNAGNTKGGPDKITFYKRYYNGSTVTTATLSKTVIDALCDEKWDVIVFQTNTERLGYYDSFKDYLANMISYVKTTCQTENGKTPVLAWHMFWAFGSKSSFVNSNYYGSQDLNYAAHVQTAKQIMRNHDIQLIIPTGTAIQSLRRSSWNNAYPGNGSGAYEFLLDGNGISHVDYMGGRYTCACTWFEFFLKPCFGISVLGNTYMPPTTYAGVKVTEENRETLQRAAVLACQSPFELSHLDEISPMDVTGNTESYDGPEKGETESFTLIDNLDW